MEQPEPSDAEVDAIIAEFDGDLRAALRALLHDIAVLAADLTASVSLGYMRGRRPAATRSARRGRSGREA